jgi:hypothetical protein
MIQRIGLALILLFPISLALVAFLPAVPRAAAQNAGQGRGDENGEGGGFRREGRGRGGRSRPGGGYGEGGGRDFRRGGDGEGNNGRGGGRGGDNQGGERFLRPSGSTNSSNATRPASSSGSGAGSSLSMDNYVKGLVRQYYKNGDMILQPDEQKSLSGKAAKADVNSDGNIDVDELIATLSGNAPATGAATGSGSGDPHGENANQDEKGRGGKGPGAKTRVYTSLAAGANTEGASDKRRTYRFTPAADRLPTTGLPSWFKSRDANGDGQVAMSEYSRTWSDRTVSEFRRYDLNNDGIVTVKEATGK